LLRPWPAGANKSNLYHQRVSCVGLGRTAAL